VGFPGHPQNSAQLWEKTHIEHPIRFVYDKQPDSIQSYRAAFEMIDESSRTCDQYLDAGTDFAHLPINRFSSHDNRRAQAGVSGEQIELMTDLAG
jgi:hypothetical protein